MSNSGWYENRLRFAGLALCWCIVVMLSASSCGPGEIVTQARNKIKSYLEGRNIYERRNVPEDATNLLGYYDIIDGAYRYIPEEDRENRFDGSSHEIKEGDRIEFYFDARIFGSSLENSTTFYTNIADRINEIDGNNNEFDYEFWPVVPLQITVGSDPQMPEIVQKALIGCQTDNHDTSDDEDGGVRSDEVQIYLPPDVGFDNRGLLTVPAKSTLLFIITDIQYIEQ